jgi:hypothetical protein
VIADMTSRERLQAAINHKPVDQLCVDFGACAVTGLAASAVHRIRQAVLGPSDYRVKIIEPYQMLGEIDVELRQALGIDIIGISPPNNMFGFRNDGWKPFSLSDGTPVLVPEKFNITRDEQGNTFIYPEGDTSVPPCAMMPKAGHFFDSLNRQPPLNEQSLDPEDNLEEFQVLGKEDLAYFEQQTENAYKNTDSGLFLTMGGLAFGDIALVPAPWMKHPKGIRDVEEWYLSLAFRKDHILKIFERQCETALKNIELAAAVIGDGIDVLFVTGTDFGAQQGLIISRETYREMFFPFQKAINDKIHELTTWKTFCHSCGAVSELIPDFIDAGFDILNPVQCSAAGMEPGQLKKEFGKDIVFWGGGVDTQKTLPFGSPEDVYQEVRERIDIFSEGSGFVFNAIHNIQANIPTENILAVFDAVNDSRKG